MVEVNNKMCYSSSGLPPKYGKIPVNAYLYNQNPNIMVGTTMMGLQLRGSSIRSSPSSNESLPSMTTATIMNRMNPFNLTTSTTTANSTSGGRLNLLDQAAITSGCELRMIHDLQPDIESTCSGEINNIITASNVNNIMDVMEKTGMNNKSLLHMQPFHHHVISARSTRVNEMTKKMENHNNKSSASTLLLPSSSLTLPSTTPMMSLFEKINKATIASSSSTTSKGISNGEGGHATNGIAARVLSSTSSTNNKHKKRGHPKCRPIDPNMDPKKAKRVLANRLSAQKSRLRKLAYLAELEEDVLSLEARVNSIAPKVTEHIHQRLLMRMENTSMKQQINTLISEQAFKNAQFQALKEERDELLQLYMLQQQQNQKQLEQHQLQEQQQQQLGMLDVFEPLQQPNFAPLMIGSENGNDINFNGGDIY